MIYIIIKCKNKLNENIGGLGDVQVKTRFNFVMTKTLFTNTHFDFLCLKSLFLNDKKKF